MKAQMAKWGNSLAVRIPKPILEKARLKEGDFLDPRERHRARACLMDSQNVLGRHGSADFRNGTPEIIWALRCLSAPLCHR
jgi:hypothetical protein